MARHGYLADSRKHSIRRRQDPGGKIFAGVLGGDHSVHIPCIRAFADETPMHIIHIDAHRDFADDLFYDEPTVGPKVRFFYNRSRMGG